MKKQNNNIARQLLKPLIDHCATTRGAKETVSRLLEKKLGRKVANHQTKSWLNPDAKQWRSPLFSTGMALLEVQSDLGLEKK